MSTFAILNRSPRHDLNVVLASLPADQVYIWSKNVAFVQSDGTAKKLAQKIGVKNRTEGQVVDGYDQIVVTEIAPNYYGWTESAIWPWLKSSFEDSKS